MKKIAIFLITFFTINLSLMSQECYSKLKVGSSWEMTMYNRKGKVTGKTISKIIEIKNEGSKTIYVIEGQSYDKKGKPKKNGTIKHEGYCENGTYYADMQGLAQSMNKAFDKNKETKGVTVEFEMFKAELPKVNTPTGTVLKDASFKITTKYDDTMMPLSEMLISLQNRTVESVENKETPAGNFKCQKVVSYVLFKVAFIKQHYKSIDWYTDGFFTVYSETYSKSGKLRGYNVLTKLNL